MPFVQKYHRKEKVLFWPDLANCHYGLQVLEYLEENGIHYVREQDNPQNCPQAIDPLKNFGQFLNRWYIVVVGKQKTSIN
jgi:hypothetical protein